MAPGAAIYHKSSLLPLSLTKRCDWCSTRGKWSLTRNLDRNWWHHHTSIKHYLKSPSHCWFSRQLPSQFNNYPNFSQCWYQSHTLVKIPLQYISHVCSCYHFRVKFFSVQFVLFGGPILQRLPSIESGTHFTENVLLQTRQQLHFCIVKW